MPAIKDLSCFKVQDGVVIENLEEGLYLVAGALLPHLKARECQGFLYPYRVDVLSYRSETDMYLIGIAEEE